MDAVAGGGGRRRDSRWPPARWRRPATLGGEFEARFFGVEREALEGVTPIGEHFEENVEAIAALKPDLIVGYAFDGEPAHERIERFEAIAPFVMIATFEPVDRVMRRFAEALGVEAEATEREAGYARRVEALRVNGPDISPLEATLEAVGVRFSPVTPAEGQRTTTSRGRTRGRRGPSTSSSPSSPPRRSRRPPAPEPPPAPCGRPGRRGPPMGAVRGPYPSSGGTG